MRVCKSVCVMNKINYIPNLYRQQIYFNTSALVHTHLLAHIQTHNFMVILQAQTHLHKALHLPHKISLKCMIFLRFPPV